MTTVWLIGALFAFGMLLHQSPDEEQRDTMFWIMLGIGCIVAWPIMLGMAFREFVDRK